MLETVYVKRLLLVEGRNYIAFGHPSKAVTRHNQTGPRQYQLASWFVVIEFFKNCLNRVYSKGLKCKFQEITGIQ